MAAAAENPFISIVIPNYNNRATIGQCIAAAKASRYDNFEVIVSDDGSTDGSDMIAAGSGVTLVRLAGHGGASKNRNAGARAARGEVLFFIDADCIVSPDTLGLVARAYREHPDKALGGTYTPLSHDGGFYGDFQSAFINYSETKSIEPDYIATHALIIGRGLFLEHRFEEDFMPILEDVEFSHRLRARGVKLLMRPEIMVGHIFNFTLERSLRNAFRKSRHWTAYSFGAGDLHRDSGTASVELKFNTMAWPMLMALMAGSALSRDPLVLAILAALVCANLWISRALVRAFFRAGGTRFGLKAVFYYMALYPLPVGLGGLDGLRMHMKGTH